MKGYKNKKEYKPITVPQESCVSGRPNPACPYLTPEEWEQFVIKQASLNPVVDLEV